MAIRFGVIAPYAVGPVEESDYAIGFAQLAEELGFESIWTVEHHVMPVQYDSVYPYDPSGRTPFTPHTPQPDPLIWLAHVAAATSRIRLGTGILILPQHNPVVLAKTVATLDRLSGGRVELGIGVGWTREEAEAVGTDFSNRGRRTDEYIQAMRALWNEPVSAFSGAHLRFADVVSQPKPVQPGGVPILIGGHSPAAARRAGRFGDGFFPLGAAPEELPGLREHLEAAARAAGRNPADVRMTTTSAPKLPAVQAYADAGVDRITIAATRGADE